MSKDYTQFGCLSAREVGCKFTLNKGSPQAFLVRVTSPGRHDDVIVDVTPPLTPRTYIRAVLVWNLMSLTSEKGSWFDVTSEGWLALSYLTSDKEFPDVINIFDVR